MGPLNKILLPVLLIILLIFLQHKLKITEDTKGNFTYVLDKLIPNTTYCVSVYFDPRDIQRIIRSPLKCIHLQPARESGRTVLEQSCFAFTPREAPFKEKNRKVGGHGAESPSVGQSPPCGKSLLCWHTIGAFRHLSFKGRILLQWNHFYSRASGQIQFCVPLAGAFFKPSTGGGGDRGAGTALVAGVPGRAGCRWAVRPGSPEGWL